MFDTKYKSFSQVCYQRAFLHLGMLLHVFLF